MNQIDDKNEQRICNPFLQENKECKCQMEDNVEPTTLIQDSFRHNVHGHLIWRMHDALLYLGRIVDTDFLVSML